MLDESPDATPAKHDAYEGPILEIENLSISFFTRLREIPAVMDFSCTVMPGEAMGLVGESGCGKSTVALGVMQDLGVNGRVVGGTIKFKGRDLNAMSDEELRDLRGSEIAMIYQEPMASLNPAMKIGKQLMEVPMIHEGVGAEEAYKRALEVVTDVRLPDPKRMLESYPHQLSGGQQQRIVIAMALMANPSLLILDEPTTALDVTVEAAVVDLVKDLGKKYGTSMLFISHNLGLVLETCDRHLRDVFRRGGRDRLHRRCLRQDAAPLHAGAVPLDPAAGGRQERAPAGGDPGQLPPAP
jgi:peptide/nickel transport system ATP-binding protein